MEKGSPSRRSMVYVSGREMGLFTDLLFPLKIVQSSSRIKTAGWGERGWNWNDQERKAVMIGLRKVNDACKEFVVAHPRMTKRTKW